MIVMKTKPPKEGRRSQSIHPNQAERPIPPRTMTRKGVKQHIAIAMLPTTPVFNQDLSFIVLSYL